MRHLADDAALRPLRHPTAVENCGVATDRRARPCRQAIPAHRDVQGVLGDPVIPPSIAPPLVSTIPACSERSKLLRFSLRHHGEISPTRGYDLARIWRLSTRG
jgi:hypothetical protein